MSASASSSAPSLKKGKTSRTYQPESSCENQVISRPRYGGQHAVGSAVWHGGMSAWQPCSCLWRAARSRRRRQRPRRPRPRRHRGRRSLRTSRSCSSMPGSRDSTTACTTCCPRKRRRRHRVSCSCAATRTSATASLKHTWRCNYRALLSPAPRACKYPSRSAVRSPSLATSSSRTWSTSSRMAAIGAWPGSPA